MQYAEGVAISVTVVQATATRNALTPRLVARGEQVLGRGERRRRKLRLVAPQRI
jgi:hypothetical protein